MVLGLIAVQCLRLAEAEPLCYVSKRDSSKTQQPFSNPFITEFFEVNFITFRKVAVASNNANSKING